MKKNGESVNIPRTAHKKDISRVLRLCVIYLLVVSLIVVPVTFSKYVSTVEGNYTGAGFAKINYNIDYTAQGYSLQLNDDTSNEFYYKKVYICLSEFTIDNAGSDVSYDYSISLSLINADNDTPLEYSSFLCPFSKASAQAPSKPAQLVSINSDTNETETSPINANCPLQFAENSAYYYLSGSRYNASVSSEGALNLNGRFEIDGGNNSHTYSLLIFIDLTRLEHLAGFEMENFEIAYTITCTQI